MNSSDPGDAIVVEIAIRATAERVFTALADPAQRVQWWGVKGKFETRHVESDLRPGGAWLMSGIGPGDRPFAIRGEYLAIDRPRLLEFTWCPQWGEPQTIVRFELDEHDGVTTVRLIHSGFADAAAREFYQGWPWILKLLQGYIENSGPGSEES